MPRLLVASTSSVLASLVLALGCASSGPGNMPLVGGSGSTVGPGSGASPAAGGGGPFYGTGGGVSLVVSDTCGNGVQDPDEECDDLNNIAGDGCSALCKIESEWSCPVFGQPCTYKPVCGDGILSSNEACDDLNTLPGDGCSADCTSVDPGWLCRVPGRPCIPWCGDGVLTFPETCEDFNTAPGDGCSPTCLTEPGWDCSSGTCIQSICGNGVQELGESCDKGADNGLFYGDPANPGCSKTCTLEPSCRANGVTGACQTFCGDGNIDVSDGEACDDGNQVPGDGCDATCQTEQGFTCDTVEEPDTEPCSTGGGDCLMLPVIYRDFDGQQVTGGHPDFFYMGATVDGQKTVCVPNASGSPAAVNGNCSSTDSTEKCTGLVNPTLNALGKPEFNPTKNGMCACRFTDWDARDILTATNGESCVVEGDGSTRYRVGYDSPLNVPVMHSAESFNQWYADSSFSTAVRGTLELAATGNGQYQFSSSDGLTVNDDIHSFCDNGSSATLESGFFPLEDQPRATVCNIWPYWLSGLTGAKCCAGSGCPVASQWDTTVGYGTCDAGTGGPLPYDTGKITGVERNFYFTTEVRYLFRFSGAGGTLAFFGDDDVWVFVNGQLALDLGGTHERLEGAVNINPTTFGLEDGKIYEIAVFHADQHPRESNYQLTLTGFATAHSACAPTCGDGVRAAGEECDDGAANSNELYGGCTLDCKFGPFCGDGVVNGPELCDAGRDNGPVYTPTNVGGCSTGCIPAHFCGDGVIDSNYGEECDDAGPSGSCTDHCTLNVR